MDNLIEGTSEHIVDVSADEDVTLGVREVGGGFSVVVFSHGHRER